MRVISARRSSRRPTVTLDDSQILAFHTLAVNRRDSTGRSLFFFFFTSENIKKFNWKILLKKRNGEF